LDTGKEVRPIKDKLEDVAANPIPKVGLQEFI